MWRLRLRRTSVRTPHHRQSRPSLTRCEDRITPAAANLAAGVLTINYTATGTTVESVTITNDGVNVDLTGNVTGGTSFAVMVVNKIVLQDTGGSSNQSAIFTGIPTYSLSGGLLSTNVESVTIISAMSVTGASAISITAPKSITVDASLSTTSGDITLSANQQATASSGDFVGIEVDGATIGSTSGKITLQGRGGDDTSGGQTGVYIHAQAIVGQGTSGQVTVVGEGGKSSGAGVLITDLGSKVTSGGGNVSIIATAKSTVSFKGSYGLLVVSDSEISAGGNGSIAISAAGACYGTTNYAGGIQLENSAINSANGDVSISGSGAGDPQVNQNSHGVWLDASKITAGGTGKISVAGVVSCGPNHGVLLENNSMISSMGGDVIVNGNGASSLTASHGIMLQTSSQIAAGGSGAVTVDGSGGSGNGGGTGVYLDGLGTQISSAGGAVSVKGVDYVPGGGGITLAQGAGILSGGKSTLTLTTNVLAMDNMTSLIRAGALGDALAVIQPDAAVANVKIDVGGIDVSNGPDVILGLSDSELSQISAGTLLIGSTAAGKITVTKHIVWATSTNVTLTTGADIQFNAGLNTIGGEIILNSKGPIAQTAGSLSTFSTITLNAASGQTATFASLNNQAGKLVVPVGVTCIVNGSFDAIGTVEVSGTLGGSGSVGSVTVTNTGKIAPGNSPGQLTTGNIVFNSGAKYDVDLAGANAGTGYDQLAVNGNVNLGGATFASNLSFAPPMNAVFTIIDNDGMFDDVTGTFNGLAEGAAVTLSGSNFVISYKGGDGNDVTLTRTNEVLAPTVTGVTFGDGTNQRSMVKQIVVTFSEAVNFVGSVASAFTLHRAGTGGTIGDVALTANPIIGPSNSVTLTFNGTLSEFGSLVDGHYNFTIDAAQISGVGGALDGNNDGTPGGSYFVIGNTTNKFFRFFGDSNGSGTVDQAVDFLAFKNAFGFPSSVFDFNNSGTVDQAVDFVKFKNNFGLTP